MPNPLSSVSRKPGLTALLGALLVLAALPLGGCDDGFQAERSPIMVFDPATRLFKFPKLRPGEPSAASDQKITVKNDGEGDLILIDFAPDFSDEFDLYYFIDDESDRQLPAVVDGRNALAEDHADRMVIAPDHSITFVLNFQPATDEAATGAFRFRANDPEIPNATLEIVSEDGAPEISVTPGSIDFGAVGVGDVAGPEEVAITNIGQIPLLISEIRMSGTGFSAWVGDVNLADDAAALDDPDGDGTPGLGPEKTLIVGVKFENALEGPAEGVMSILSNDPVAETVNVTLTANGARPCIRVSPAGEEGLMFGGVQIEGRLQKPITLESCGGQPLRIDSISMSEDSDAAITLVEDSVPGLPALMPAMTPGNPLPNRNIKVQCTPTEATAYGGWVKVVSNDPLNPEATVRVTCLGVLNACPRPAVERDTFRVAPLEVIPLDGTPSEDEDGPGGKPVQYRWEVRERPEGSQSVPVERLGPDPQAPADGATPDDLTTPQARFFVDVVGTYTIELFVMDNMDQEAPSENCPEPHAVVTIVAESDDDIHVEMSWHTPGDPNETDLTGSDVDLHMLHPLGDRWSRAPYDCYYSNPSPDWGIRGDASDNPTLDLDDVNGAGPENITLDNPEDTEALGAPYRVGVDYYREESTTSFTGYGPSYVTVKIYLGGVLAWENAEPKELVRTHDFWEVAQIIWGPNDHRVRVVDRVSQVQGP